MYSREYLAINLTIFVSIMMFNKDNDEFIVVSDVKYILYSYSYFQSEDETKADKSVVSSDSNKRKMKESTRKKKKTKIVEKNGSGSGVVDSLLQSFGYEKLDEIPTKVFLYFYNSAN